MHRRIFGRIGLFLVAFALLASALAVALPASATPSTVNVVINSYSFTPSSITVVIGVNNTVTWTNQQTGVVHTVTSNTGIFSSSELSSGQSFTYTFSAPGTYAYHCKIHTYMQGTVVVLAAPGSSSSTTSAASSSTSGPTSSSTSTSSSSVASSSSSASSGGVPEFPFAAGAIAALTFLVLVSYMFIRRASRSSRVPGVGPSFR